MRPLPIYLGVVSLLVVSCQRDKEEIKTYTVAKDPASQPVPMPGGVQGDPHAGVPGMGAGKDPHAGVPGMSPGGDPHAGLTAEQLASVGGAPNPSITDAPPANWKKQPGSSMRQASYLVEGEEGTSTDISLIILRGAAGGNLDNVNRWRGQLGLPPVDDAGLKESSENLTTPAGPAILVDLAGLAEGADAKKDGRMVGVIATHEGDAWFYKMRGNNELTASEKTNFVAWVQSVKPAPQSAAPGAAPAEPGAAPAAPTAPAAPAAPAAGGANATGGADGRVSWQAPQGWTISQTASSRYATFNIAGEGDAKGELAITHFPGDVGGDLANVNRWRGQISLPPIEESALAPLVTKLNAGSGKTLSVVDLNGPQVRCLAAWTRHGADTWFFKFTGPDALVGAEKARFNAFIESVRFNQPE